MFKDIAFVCSGLLIGLIIWFLKTIIFSQLKEKTQQIISSEGQVNDRETFNVKKLFEGLGSVIRGDLWGKSMSQELSIRTWLIRFALIGIIIGVIYGYGWYKGRLGAPVALNLQGKEVTIKLNEHYLRIERDGTTKVVDSEGNVLKVIKVKDIPELRKAIKPYGFILEPMAVAGVGISNVSIDFEGGLGLRYLKFYKWFGDVSITNKGAYPLGVGYKLTDNTTIGASIGTGYKENERGLFQRILLKIGIKF